MKNNIEKILDSINRIEVRFLDGEIIFCFYNFNNYCFSYYPLKMHVEIRYYLYVNSIKFIPDVYHPNLEIALRRKFTFKIKTIE